MGMDIASVSAGLAIGGASTDSGLAMLKKSLDVNQAEMSQLLQALPAPQPAHLGQNVNQLA